jgi:hypothetical protein
MKKTSSKPTPPVKTRRILTAADIHSVRGGGDFILVTNKGTHRR